MPKLKTNRSVAKRFRIKKSGKIKKKKSGTRHILGKKGRKRKRHLRKANYLTTTNAKKIRRLLPYG